MINGYEWFRSVEWIWCLWLASVGTLVWLAVRAVRTVRQLRGRSWRRLLRNESGAAYTLSYVMTFPFYLLLIGLALECSLLIVAKIGSVYAAYAAARSVAVWDSAGSSNTVSIKAHQAAALAMTPFASGASNHQIIGGARPTARQLNALTKAYREYRGAEETYSDEYLGRKCRFAWASTKVEHQVSDGEPGLVTVTLSYRAPLHIPGIARILGTRAADGSFHYYPMESQAVVNSETPPEGSTGISYP